jgi:hypothetical protein
MNWKLVAFSLGCIAAMSSCADPKLEKVEELKTECIEIHDEVMPKMGSIVELSTEIKDWKKKLDGDTTDSVMEFRVSLVSHVTMLDSAHESMMVWMQDYEVDYETSHNADSAISYYENEIVRIAQVRALMLKSIDDGKKVLEERN